MQKKHYLDTGILLTLFFLSGFSGLIYQSAWSQQLSLIFGSTELAIAAVLASYMGGLALGASYIGRMIQRVKNPVRLYAILELAIAVSALCVPYFLQFIAHVYSFFYTTPQLSSMSAHNAIMYVLGSFAVLLIPTTLMGATLPLLSDFAVQRGDNFGKKIGRLYATNTFGACMGALISAFLLLPNYGLGMTTYTAVVINVIIFIVGVLYFRRNTETRSNTALTQDNQSTTQKSIHWILPIILVSGAVSFAYEILWTRLLSHMLGSSIYSFGVMLFVFLLALALGAFLGSSLSKKFRATTSFCFVQLAIALCFFISFFFANDLTDFDMKGHYGSWSFINEAIIIGLATLLPGALFIGMTFPLAINILATENHNSGEVSARVYSWNTVGAIIGSLLMGFYLLSHYGFVISTKILASISIVLAISTVIMSKSQLKITPILMAGILLIWLVPLQEPIKLLSYSTLGKKSQTGKLHYMGIGESTTVILMDQGSEMRLLTNGLPESSIEMAGKRDGQYFLAHWLSMLPTVVNPHAKDMLIIGLGAGITLKAVPESIKNIDVVELEQEVVNANRSLSKWRGIDPLSDPRLKLHVNDARNAIRNSTQAFDIVVSQPSHPWTAGASNLYTREFFATVKSRLNNDGVFVQWIGMRFIDEALLKSLLATLNAEFQHVELFQPLSTGGLIFVSSDQPINLNTEYFNQPENQKKWQTLGTRNLAHLNMSRRLNAQDSKIFADNALLSTDYFNVLKLRSPKIIKSSLNKPLFNQILIDYDPLITKIKNNSFSTIRRLIKEHAFHRLKYLLSYIDDPIIKQTALLMIQDAQQKPQLRAKTQAKLLKYLTQLFTQDANKHQSAIEELTYYLMTSQIKPLLNNKRPVLQKIITNIPIANELMDASRLLQLRKWNKIQNMEKTLARIDDTHPAFELANSLRIQWRLKSQDFHHKEQAMIMIDEQLTLLKNSNQLIEKVTLANEMKRVDTAIATLYELKAMLPPSNNRRGAAVINKLISQTIAVAQQQGLYDETFIEKINTLKNK